MREVPKPWGHELIWAEAERYVGKVLHIEAGRRLSLQYHEVKDETLLLLSGQLLLELGPVGGDLAPRELRPFEAVRIVPHTVHRMTAITDCDIVEVSTPELQDVVRLADDYGREGTSQP